MIKKLQATILLFMAFCATNAWATDSLSMASDSIEIKIKTVTLANRNTTNLDSVILEPSVMFLPLIFEGFDHYTDTLATEPKAALYSFNAGDKWLKDAVLKARNERETRYRVMIDAPQLNRYNLDMLPEPPKQYEIVADPSNRTIALEKKELKNALDMPADEPIDVVNVRNWLHTFKGSIHFSQAYISENWYQGGNNNLNILGNFVWDVNLNQNKYPNLLFDNTIQYKIGLQSAPQDSLRGYSISEDLLQINSKFGYKAFKHWYYSTTLLFKTQVLNNFAPNTNNLKASFLTPGELNLGLGMTYNAKSKNGYATFDLSLSPVSYNMKICRENTRVNPTSMGVDEGKHLKHKIGSSLEARFRWQITPAISWNSRLYAFTDYEFVQGDWEHTFNFSINKYLSTQFYMHLRYDNAVSMHDSWKYWQFKEIVSIGLTYRFSMQ